LTATVVSKEPPIPSVQAFNAQIVIGSKDEALRKAADLFDTVATRLEKSQKREELYWVNALKIRRNNWRLIPSPLPRGTFIGKGVDRTARDFLVAYGLEECKPSLTHCRLDDDPHLPHLPKAHIAFRRGALANLSDVGGKNELVFANRQRNRMQISLSITTPEGKVSATMNSLPAPPKTLSVEEELAWAQTEIIDQEIFSYLVKEAPAMPTIIGRVSERTIGVDAADGIELKFELVSLTSPQLPRASHSFLIPKVKDEEVQAGAISPICDVIYHALHILLLRKHEYQKGVRLKAIANFQPPPDEKEHPISPPILQPIVDFLQYNLFCERLELELNKAASGLTAAGINTTVFFNGVGETGDELVKFISDIPQTISHISGEAVLTIADRWVHPWPYCGCRLKRLLTQAYCPLHLCGAITSNCTPIPSNDSCILDGPTLAVTSERNRALLASPYMPIGSASQGRHMARRLGPPRRTMGGLRTVSFIHSAAAVS
jgi:mediator of RNA polymerase II transcription subunit 17